MGEPEFLTDTRATYDEVAAAYVEACRDGLADRAWDRAFLTLFAELLPASAGRRVADVGCGPGHITQYLRGLGLDAFGIDLSPVMLTKARQTYPDLDFREGSILRLPVTDGSLAGLVAQYSFNTASAQHLSEAFSGFRRALAPGGLVFVAFSVREDPTRLTSWLDHDVVLDLQRMVPDDVTRLLTEAVQASTVREPHGPDESLRHAYLIAANTP